MKRVFEVCFIAFVLSCVARAQDPTKPMLRPGITVKMPFSSQAVEMPAADKEDVKVVSITPPESCFSACGLWTLAA